MLNVGLRTSAEARRQEIIVFSFKTYFLLCDQFQGICCVCEFLTPLEPCMANYGLLSVFCVYYQNKKCIYWLISYYTNVLSCSHVTASHCAHYQLYKIRKQPIWPSVRGLLPIFWLFFVFPLKWMLCQHCNGSSALEPAHRHDFWISRYRPHFLESRASVKTNISPCLLSW